MTEPSCQGSRMDFARLIVATGRKDRQAFSSLFSHFAPRVKAMMLRVGMPDHVAEDLAQETMLAVWKKAHSFDPGGLGPAAWIYTIARNLRIDWLRRDRRMRRLSDTDLLQPIAEQKPADALLASLQLEEKVRRSLEMLNEEQLKVLMLSFFDNKAHPAIADELGIPLGTVKSRLRLAIRRLRLLLEDLQ